MKSTSAGYTAINSTWTRLPRWRLVSESGTRTAAIATSLGALVSFVVAGLISDDWSAAFAGVTAFAACWMLLWAFVALHALDPAEKRWLIALCIAALALRALVATLILNGPWDYLLFGEDQIGYDHIPSAIASSWTQGFGLSYYETNPIISARKGYIYLVALQYYLLGEQLIVPRIVNSMAGALITFYTVLLTGRLFGRAEGRVAGVWATFFPALILWSALNLRDIWLALSVLVIIYHAFVLRDRFSTTSVATIVAHLVWIHYNREYLVFIMVVACVAVFVFARSTNLFRDLLVAILLASILLVLYQSLGLGKEGLEWLDLDRLAEQRGKLAREDVGRSGYLGDIDIRSPTALIAAFPLLLGYFLYSPFPWQMTALRRLVIAPEMAFWYWLTPLVFVSFRRVLRERASRQLALLMTLAVVTVAFAVPSANMGLAYRYRAQIIPLYLAFAASGFVGNRGGSPPGPPQGRAKSKALHR